MRTSEKVLRAAYETARRRQQEAVRRVEKAEALTTLARQSRTRADRVFREAYDALQRAGIAV